MTAEAMRADTGYDIMAFDITTSERVPCVWVMAVNPADDGRAKVVCAAGSHLDPERATENALSELGPILTDLTRRYPPQRDKAHAMALDSSLVTVTSDHALLYADPSVFSRLSFLTDSTHVRPLNSLPQPTANDDLRADLVDLIAQYTANGLDVIVVNQTTPEHQAGGFTCVKVLIPGTLSMTFGHTHRRTTGLPGWTRPSRARRSTPIRIRSRRSAAHRPLARRVEDLVPVPVHRAATSHDPRPFPMANCAGTACVTPDGSGKTFHARPKGRVTTGTATLTRRVIHRRHR
ncbi:hypothetical protein GCM10029964_077680 [Kibdelosporangium lantanae]